MNIVLYCNPNSHAAKWIERFQTGLRCHGIDAAIKSPNEYKPSDLAVFWGHRQHHIINGQLGTGGHYLVMERGYMGDRFYWTSLGFDGLNGRAAFPVVDDDLSRWKLFFEKMMRPLRSISGNTALIMGQVPGDASLAGVDFRDWLESMVKELKAKRYTVAFRPHPKAQNMRLQGVDAWITTLEDALDRAALVVTYNSNSGVDAIMAGLPVYAEDRGSMVYELSNRKFERHQKTRYEWCKKMAYTQWSPHEIENGLAWRFLRMVLDGNRTATTDSRLY